MMSEEPYTFDDINKNNPYKVDILNNDNDESSMIPQDTIREAFKLQRKAYIVKLVSILDFVSNIIYGFYGYFMYIIFALCSLAGYASTVTFNRHLLIYYLFYQYLQICFKLVNCILFISLAASSEMRDYIEHHNGNNTLINLANVDYSVAVPATCILFIIQLIITHYVYDFYKCLPTPSQVSTLLI